MVKVKTPLSSLEACIIDGIKDIQANNIKFHNIAFDCWTIEDYEGRVFFRKRTGKWIVFSPPDDLHCGVVECPFCGEELIAEPNEYNFCPNCGADMRGEQE